MPNRRNVLRLAIASLLAAAVCAPTATAKPIYDGAFKSKADTSTVKKPRSTIQIDKVPGARPPVSEFEAPQAAPPDLRSENTADPSRAPAPPAGLPTWPAYPQPLVPRLPQPVAADGNGDGIDWPIAALILAGALALGGVAVAGQRLRAQTRPAH